jgi:hypothetical protein
MQHRNAPLTPNGRRRLVALVEEDGLTLNPQPHLGEAMAAGRRGRAAGSQLPAATAPRRPTASLRSPTRPATTASARSVEGQAGGRGRSPLSSVYPPEPLRQRPRVPGIRSRPRRPKFKAANEKCQSRLEAPGGPPEEG